MHKIIFFPENLNKILGFTSKFRYGGDTLNTGILIFGPIQIMNYSAVPWIWIIISMVAQW